MSDDARVRTVNSALFQLGNEPVPDLSDAALADSLAAVKVLRVMDESRETVLARHGWLCALEYTVLQPVIIAGYANWKYPYVYQLPGDGVMTWEIEGCALTEFYSSYWRQRWELGSIDTDMGPRQIIRAANRGWQGGPSWASTAPVDPAGGGSLRVAYVRRASWGALSAHVRDSIAFDMAARAAISVTGDANLAKKLEAAAERKVLLAISTDAKQIEGEEPYAPSIPQALRDYTR